MSKVAAMVALQDALDAALKAAEASGLSREDQARVIASVLRSAGFQSVRVQP